MADRIVFENASVVVLVREKAAPPDPDPEPPIPDPQPMSSLYDSVNKARAVVGAGPLKRDAHAERMAQSWAETMARTGDYHHNPALAADIDDPWFSIAENIAWTEGSWSTESRVHQMWLDSPPHRRNIEGPAYSHAGVGRAEAGGRHYWVEVFVDRMP